MNVNRYLEIIIPTYNRKEHLTRTLTQLTAPESPVKDVAITVLDNACTDGSDKIIEEFAAKFPNITHVRHHKNIGGNANIARCFELARAPYVWVVCDDDSFRWEAWPEIDNALQTEQYDILLTRKDDLKGSSDIAKIIRQLTFLPAGIYRTANITSGVLMNIMANIPNMFPHLAVACEVLNRKGTIFLPQGEIMDQCTLDTKRSADEWNVKGHDTYAPAVLQNMFWTVGFLNSLQMIEDQKLRTYVIDHLGRHGFGGYMLGAFRKNYTRFGRSKLNEAFIKNGINCRQRFVFFWVCLFLKIITLFHRKKHV